MWTVPGLLTPDQTNVFKKVPGRKLGFRLVDRKLFRLFSSSIVSILNICHGPETSTSERFRWRAVVLSNLHIRTQFLASDHEFFLVWIRCAYCGFVAHRSLEFWFFVMFSEQIHQLCFPSKMSYGFLRRDWLLVWCGFFFNQTCCALPELCAPEL